MAKGKKQKTHNTLVINLFAGPGAGKSACMGAIFADLKRNHVDCEMVMEYAKDQVWLGNFAALKDQLDIYANQRKRILNLVGKVDVVITDSPMLNSMVYDRENDTLLQQIVLRDHNRLNNMNFFVTRGIKYMKNGRVQNRKQAIDLDNSIMKMLRDHKVDFETFEPADAGLISRKIIARLNGKT